MRLISAKVIGPIVLTMMLSTFLAVACGETGSRQPSTPQTGHKGSGSQSYLLRYSDEYVKGVEFYQWSENSDGDISGQAQTVYAQYGTPVVESDSVAFTGTVDEGNVSLNFEDPSLPDATGTLHDDTLALNSPDEDGTLETRKLHTATVEDYNRAVREFRQEVERPLKCEGIISQKRFEECMAQQEAADAQN